MNLMKALSDEYARLRELPIAKNEKEWEDQTAKARAMELPIVGAIEQCRQQYDDGLISASEFCTKLLDAVFRLEA